MSIAPRLFRNAGVLAVSLAALVAAGGQAFAACTFVGPSSGVAGATYTITAASGLSGATSVSFGSVSVPAGSFTTHTDGEIQLNVPTEQAPTVSSVTNTGFLVLGNGQSYGPATGGYSVDIQGTNLSAAVSVTVAGASCGSATFTYTDGAVTAVTFAGTNATNVNVVSSTEITATVPQAAAGVTNVVIIKSTVNSGTSGFSKWTYVTGSPSITAITPFSGLTTVAQQVTVVGTNFVPGATTVTFHCPAGNTTPTPTQSPGNTSSFTVMAPTCSTAGPEEVDVTTPVGSASTTYTYNTPNTPSVADVNPSTGSTSGGTTVTITGSYFTDTTAVYFGTTKVTNFNLVDNGTITVSAPAHAAGTVDVEVENAANLRSTANPNDQFTYATAPPTVSALFPTTGSSLGGTSVIVAGTGLTGATQVMFGSVAATSFTVNGDNQITAVAPAQASGTIVDVMVTTPNGTSAKSVGDVFTYVTGTPAPTVTSVSPPSGPVSGGTTVIISGANFNTTPGATTVDFGDVILDSLNNPTSITSVTATSITLVTPAHAPGAINVSVTTSSGTGTLTNAYTYQVVTLQPAVTNVAPSSGPTQGGTVIKITGVNFNGTPQVTVGGFPAAGVTLSSDGTYITATTPAANPTASTGARLVVVTTSYGSTSSGGDSSQSGFVTDDFTYTASSPNPAAAPSGLSIAPSSGPTAGSQTVTISGTNLTGADSGCAGCGVTFDGIAATNVVVNANGTSLTATTPVHNAGNVTVTVTNAGGSATVPGGYTYVNQPPTVTLVKPATGSFAGGTAVTISGTNFLTGSTVQFGTGNFATFVNVVNSTTIQAVTPPGTVNTTVDVIVTTPAPLSGTGTKLFTYVAGAAPTVTAISPNSGPTSGGQTVTISGTNFNNPNNNPISVTIGGAPATNVVANANGTSLTATTPAGTAGLANVVVTTQAGTGTGANLYTYESGPTVTLVSPASGLPAGGNTVTITGTNFDTTPGGTTVKFGAIPATGVSVTDTQHLTVTAPAGTGSVDVTVTTSGGTSPIGAADKYTYEGAPTVALVSPSSGLLAGGYTVTIGGSGFTNTTAVKFGNTNASGFSVSSDGTTITATVPAGIAAGPVDVTVTTPVGTSIKTSADVFTYLGNGTGPIVTSVSPSFGSGGTGVTIIGQNFTAATAVTFGAAGAASSFVVISSTQISAIAPAHAVGLTVELTVTTPVGSSTACTCSADQFTYGNAPGNKTTTSLSLVSSPNPSNLGQLVTFVATVTGAAPTGTVSFAENGTVLATAPLVPSTATTSTASFQIASLPAGNNPVTASYAGDANNAPDPETVNQYVNAPSDSVKLRELQIAVMSIESSTSAQAITGAIDSAIAAGFAGTCPAAPTPNGSGFTYCIGLGGPEAQVGPAPGPQQAETGPLPPPPRQARAKVDDDFATLGYADGLPGTAWTPPQNPQVAGDLTPYAVRPAGAPIVVAQPRNWLAWMDVRGTDVESHGSANDLHGLQGNAMFGVTRRFSDSFLVGVTGGYENFDYTSQTYNGVLRGQGFTGGAYLGWRFGTHLRLEAAGTWSDIFANAKAGTASGSFTGTRWLGFGGLTGNFAWRDTVFEPSAQVYTLWEHENGYTDSLGTQQANHDFDTGRASGGLKISHAFPASVATFAPYVGFYGDYYFTMDNANAVPGLTAVPLLQGWAGRATGGVTTIFHSGAQVSAGGEFSGLGNDMQIWTLTLRGSVPF